MAGTIQAFVRTVLLLNQTEVVVTVTTNPHAHRTTLPQDNTHQPSSLQAPQLPQTSTAAGPPNSTTTTGLYCVNADTPVLLQTAQAYIHKPSNPSCGMTIRLMLDRGSQRSYITQRVKDMLGLESKRAEEVRIQNIWI